MGKIEVKYSLIHLSSLLQPRINTFKLTKIGILNSVDTNLGF